MNMGWGSVVHGAVPQQKEGDRGLIIGKGLSYRCRDYLLVLTYSVL